MSILYVLLTPKTKYVFVRGKFGNKSTCPFRKRSVFGIVGQYLINIWQYLSNVRQCMAACPAPLRPGEEGARTVTDWRGGRPHRQALWVGAARETWGSGHGMGDEPLHIYIYICLDLCIVHYIAKYIYIYIYTPIYIFLFYVFVIGKC